MSKREKQTTDAVPEILGGLKASHPAARYLKGPVELAGEERTLTARRTRGRNYEVRWEGKVVGQLIRVNGHYEGTLGKTNVGGYMRSRGFEFPILVIIPEARIKAQTPVSTESVDDIRSELASVQAESGESSNESTPF